MKLFEANRSLTTYKKLLHVLGDYTLNFPGTGMGKLFNQAVENGKKILPTDKLALEILWRIVSNETPAAAIHKILNMRFSNLPTELQPMTKTGRSKEIAFWSTGSSVSDKVKSLIDFEGKGKKGVWTDVDGNKTELLDIAEEEK